MSVTVNGKTYYRTAEVCRMVGISRSTLFRWLNEGLCKGSKYRDCRGWRLFTKAQIDELKAKTCQISRSD